MATKVAAGVVGPTGPTGPTGPQGPQGPSGAPSAGVSLQSTQVLRVGTAYGTLDPTPDQVTVTTTTGQLLAITYTAPVFEQNAGAGRIAIFINGTQLLSRALNSTGAPAPQETGIGGSAGTGRRCYTIAGGLHAEGFASASVTPAPSAYETMTPYSLTWGNICLVRVPAGTHTVDVRYKATSGWCGSFEGPRELRAWAVA